MRIVGTFMSALLGAVMIGGCNTGTFLDDAGTAVGEESQAEKAAREAAVASVEPIQSVRNIELGRTRDGFIVTAFGTAPGLGYSLPRLRPRRGGSPGTDGFIDLDFVATAPQPGFELPVGTTRTRAVRADLPIKSSALRRAQGIRVHALRGGVQASFSGAADAPESASESEQ